MFFRHSVHRIYIIILVGLRQSKSSTPQLIFFGISADKSSITAVTPQQVTPSPRYFRKIHGENPQYYPSYRGITIIPITMQLSSVRHKFSKLLHYMVIICIRLLVFASSI